MLRVIGLTISLAAIITVVIMPGEQIAAAAISGGAAGIFAGSLLVDGLFPD